MCSILYIEGQAVKLFNKDTILLLFNYLREYGADGYGLFMSRIDGIYRIVTSLDYEEVICAISERELQLADTLILHARAGTHGAVDIVNSYPIYTISRDVAYVTFMRGEVDRSLLPPPYDSMLDKYVEDGYSDAWIVHELCMKKMFNIVERLGIDVVHIHVRGSKRRVYIIDNSGESGRDYIDGSLIYASPRDVLVDVRNVLKQLRRTSRRCRGRDIFHIYRPSR